LGCFFVGFLFAFLSAIGSSLRRHHNDARSTEPGSSEAESKLGTKLRLEESDRGCVEFMAAP
jgi:hypothetical protein